MVYFTSQANYDQWVYHDKKEKVLSKFREDFGYEYFNKDPMFRAVAEKMIRNDASPYDIIEYLIKERNELISRFEDVLNKRV